MADLSKAITMVQNCQMFLTMVLSDELHYCRVKEKLLRFLVVFTCAQPAPIVFASGVSGPVVSMSIAWLRLGAFLW